MNDQWTQWLRGVTDLLVLSVLERGRSYGYEIAQALAGAGFEDLNEATVYSALRRLDADGFVRSTLVASSDGPARRYYTLTARGRGERTRRVDGWHAFVTVVDGVVVEGRPSKARSHEQTKRSGTRG